MAIDGFFINSLVNEIKENIVLARVEKINQISNDLYTFNLYIKGKRLTLSFKLHAPNAAVFLSENIKNNTYDGSTHFLNILKKYLEGSIIFDVSQYKKDRVIIFTFSANDLLEGKVTYVLYLELMGRHNNLILTKDNIIIEAFSKRFSADSRSVIPKLPFTFFESNKSDYPTTSFDLIPTNDFLFKNYLGFSKELSNYLYETKVDLNTILVNPTLNLDTNNFYWFDIYDASASKKHYRSLSNLLENINIVKDISNEKYANFIEKEILKAEKKLSKIEDSINLANTNLSMKHIGDYIYSSGLDLNQKFSSITTYNNEEIALDATKTLNENAQHYYNVYQKAKRATNYLDIQKEETVNHIKLFKQFSYDLSLDNVNYDEIQSELKVLGLKVKVKKQPKQRKIDILKIEYNNALFYIGKNNLQNEHLTNDIATNKDYFFHAKDIPGSHIILRGELNNPNIAFAAMLAAKYSYLKGIGTISVNYSSLKYVKKIPKIPGYRVILSRYETVHIKVDDSLLETVLVANKLK